MTDARVSGQSVEVALLDSTSDARMTAQIIEVLAPLSQCQKPIVLEIPHPDWAFDIPLHPDEAERRYRDNWHRIEWWARNFKGSGKTLAGCSLHIPHKSSYEPKHLLENYERLEWWARTCPCFTRVGGNLNASTDLSLTLEIPYKGSLDPNKERENLLRIRDWVLIIRDKVF